MGSLVTTPLAEINKMFSIGILGLCNFMRIQMEIKATMFYM